jgi:Glutaredoxin-like domain (DUF836)
MNEPVVLYERAGCHLCDEMQTILDEVLGADGYLRVDVDASDDLVLRYGFRVPVLAVGGRDVLEAPASAAEVRRVARKLAGADS